MPVQVQRRAGAGMTHDLWQHLRRVSRLDHQRRGSVPQVVNTEAVTETGAAAGRYEDRAPPVRQAHDAASGHGEHELVGVFASDGRSWPAARTSSYAPSVNADVVRD